MTPTDETTTLAAQIEALAERVAQGGPHEWGYRDLAEGSFIADKWPFEVAALLPAIVTALRQAEAAPGVVEALREAYTIGFKDGEDGDFNPDGYLARAALPNALATTQAFDTKGSVYEECAKIADKSAVCNKAQSDLSEDREFVGAYTEASEIAAAIRARADLARQHGAREGYVLVPKEPTEATVAAMAQALNAEYGDDCLEAIDRPLARSAYAAMIAAAPATDVGEGK